VPSSICQNDLWDWETLVLGTERATNMDAIGQMVWMPLKKNISQSFSSTVTWCFVIKCQEPSTQWCGIISQKNGNLSQTTIIPKILHNIPLVFVGWQPFLDAEGSWMLTVQAVPVLSARTNHAAALWVPVLETETRQYVHSLAVCGFKCQTLVESLNFIYDSE